MLKKSMWQGVPLLHDFLIQSAERLPHKTALVCQKRKIPYEKIDKDSNLIAQSLIRLGVERGDRVMIFGENSVETATAFWAILKANAVVSIINPLTKTEKLLYLLNDCRAKVLIAEARLSSSFESACQRSPHLRGIIIYGDPPGSLLRNLPNLKTWPNLFQEAMRPLRADLLPERTCIDLDLASIMYTSGSTGEPKGVMLTHRNMLAAALSISTYLEMTEDDVVLNLLPLSFDYGLYQMILSFRVGATLVLEQSFAYPGQSMKLIAEEKITAFPGMPMIFSIMKNMKNLDKFDLSSIRFVTSTAATLSLKDIQFLRRTFPSARIYSMYGLTECKRCSYLPPEDIDRKPLSVGVAIPNTEFWVVDEDNHLLGPNEVGMLVVRGATVMKGYWEKPEETQGKLRSGAFAGEQILYTGDLCKIDEEGYLYFVGRMDDIIKTRGEKVAPKEVENVIHSVAGVREVAVIGVEDDVLGQAIKAYVVLEDGSHLTPREILAYCGQYLETFMIPKYVEIVDRLPRTHTGKILKNALR